MQGRASRRRRTDRHGVQRLVGRMRTSSHRGLGALAAGVGQVLIRDDHAPSALSFSAGRRVDDGAADCSASRSSTPAPRYCVRKAASSPLSTIRRALSLLLGRLTAGTCLQAIVRRDDERSGRQQHKASRRRLARMGDDSPAALRAGIASASMSRFGLTSRESS